MVVESRDPALNGEKCQFLVVKSHLGDSFLLVLVVVVRVPLKLRS